MANLSVDLWSNSSRIRKAVQEAVSPTDVTNHAIGDKAGLRTNSAGTPIRADAIITTGVETGELQRYAVAKSARYVVCLPEAAEWLCTQVESGSIRVMIGSDGAKLWR